MKRLLPRLLPWLVGLVALAITVALVRHEQRVRQQALRASFELGLRQTASRVEQRIASYETALRGAQGLFRAAGSVDERAFASYVEALLAGADFAGLQFLGHVGAGRSADGEPTAVVDRVAPGIGHNLRVIGHDLWQDPVRRAALQQSRDSGSIAVTRRLRLLSEPDGVRGESQDAFLMVLPLYAPGQPLANVGLRREHHIGWVYAAFRMSDLMSSLYGEGMPGLALRIHDGVALDDATLMFRSGGASEQAPRFEAQEYIGFAGHTWTLVVRTQPDFEVLHRQDVPRIIGVAGTGLAVLLGLLTHLLVRGRERAHAAAAQMTRELSASEARYRRIVDTADQGIWMGDASLCTSFVNPKAQALLGLASAELSGRPLAQLLAGADPQAMAAGLARRLQAGALRDELPLLRADGSALWVLLTMTPIVGDDGRPGSVLAMFTDISEARQAEARRLQLEAQLRESQKMEAIGTLAGGIAHDFNNILAAILGNVALARERLPVVHAAQPHLAQIGEAGAHARNLVQQIVAFGRRQPLARTVQPLAPLVEASAALLGATLPAGVALQRVLPPMPVWARVDGNQLQQVLMNLCTNAWHALPAGHGRIEVGLGHAVLDADAIQPMGLAEPGPYAHLWVSDNGSGMDESVRLRIFEPFFTTKPVGQGTGLGLSVVHGIVIAHDGAIRVHSAPGHGTRFDLYLPQLPAPEHVPATERPLPPLRLGRGERLLYVDDDPVMVTLAEALLERSGYRVRSFGDAASALQALQAAPDDFDAVITDYNMPGQSGLDVARAVLALRPQLPLIISSGYLSEEIRAAAQAAGVRHLLQKEFTAEQLVPLVQQVLSEAMAARPTSSPHS